MGTSAKRPAPTGISTRSNCSGHEDCQTGKCNHTRKLWNLKSPTPGAHYEKKRRTARLARSRGKRPRPRSTARGFTLIEFLIVLAVVGIIALLILPTACGLGLGSAEAAKAAARQHVGDLGLQVNGLACAGSDSDGDGYISCTVRAWEPTKQQAVSLDLECASGAPLKWTKGCKTRMPEFKTTTEQP